MFALIAAGAPIGQEMTIRAATKATTDTQPSRARIDRRDEVNGGCCNGVTERRLTRQRETVVADQLKVERRKERREIHIDRRKSDVDFIEHLTEGLHVDRTRATSHDRVVRHRARKKGG